MNVLIIGRGSIGKKHLKTLEMLSPAYDLSIKVFEPSGHGKEYYEELAKKLLDSHIDAVFVCNPTSMHTETTLVCLRAGAHVFLEKPVSAQPEETSYVEIQKLLSEKKLTLMVGYDMRFNPWIEKMHELTEAKTIGDIWGVRVMAGQYLPDWRPDTDYRKSYSAQRALGGGALLDLSHELDYLQWLLPKRVMSVTARNIHTNRLETDTEDISSMILEYADKSTAQVQLDYLTVPYRRSLELYGDEGTILWDDNSHELRVYTKSAGEWQTITVSVEEATGPVIFKKELSHFFECIKNKAVPLNSFENSVNLMRVISAAVQSSEENKTITL